MCPVSLTSECNAPRCPCGMPQALRQRAGQAGAWTSSMSALLADGLSRSNLALQTAEPEDRAAQSKRKLLARLDCMRPKDCIIEPLSAEEITLRGTWVASELPRLQALLQAHGLGSAIAVTAGCFVFILFLALAILFSAQVRPVNVSLKSSSNPYAPGRPDLPRQVVSACSASACSASACSASACSTSLSCHLASPSGPASTATSPPGLHLPFVGEQQQGPLHLRSGGVCALVAARFIGEKATAPVGLATTSPPERKPSANTMNNSSTSFRATVNSSALSMLRELALFVIHGWHMLRCSCLLAWVVTFAWASSSAAPPLIRRRGILQLVLLLLLLPVVRSQQHSASSSTTSQNGLRNYQATIRITISSDLGYVKCASLC